LEKGKPFDAVTRADQGVVAAARALLVLEGIDPVSNEEVLKAFREKTVASGIVSKKDTPLMPNWASNFTP
jgi:uncharacterized protein (UPF0332 family)